MHRVLSESGVFDARVPKRRNVVQSCAIAIQTQPVRIDHASFPSFEWTALDWSGQRLSRLRVG